MSKTVCAQVYTTITAPSLVFSALALPHFAHIYCKALTEDEVLEGLVYKIWQDQQPALKEVVQCLQLKHLTIAHSILNFNWIRQVFASYTFF